MSFFFLVLEMQVEMFKGQHHDVYNILRNKINKGKENEREREGGKQGESKYKCYQSLGI